MCSMALTASAGGDVVLVEEAVGAVAGCPRCGCGIDC